VPLWAVLGAVFFLPLAMGAFDMRPYVFIASMLLVLTAYSFGPTRSRHAKHAGLVLVALCFAVSLSELMARPLLFYIFDFRPADRFIYPWPPLPLLQRYVADVHFEGPTYGDLAAASGRREWREERRIRFVTDAYGFRNELSDDTSKHMRPLDMIVLGDSFGVAAGTSQENTLSSILARDYDQNVYNLSISRENPQQEFANLVLERERLKTRKSTVVLWLVFPGNDLDEPYYRELENPQPVWPGLSTRLVKQFRDFRAHSALRRLMSQGGSDQIIERRFLDGRRILFLATYAQRRTRTAEDIGRHPNLESLKVTLGAMERLALEKQFNVAVVLVPSKEEVYAWVLDGLPPWSSNKELSGFSVVLRMLCEQHGFRFLDLKPALVDASRRVYESSRALLWWSDDSHWNDDGQRVTASTLNDNLLHGNKVR